MFIPCRSSVVIDRVGHSWDRLVLHPLLSVPREENSLHRLRSQRDPVDPIRLDKHQREVARRVLNVLPVLVILRILLEWNFARPRLGLLIVVGDNRTGCVWDAPTRPHDGAHTVKRLPPLRFEVEARLLQQL